MPGKRIASRIAPAKGPQSKFISPHQPPIAQSRLVSRYRLGGRSCDLLQRNRHRHARHRSRLRGAHVSRRQIRTRRRRTPAAAVRPGLEPVGACSGSLAASGSTPSRIPTRTLTNASARRAERSSVAAPRRSPDSPGWATRASRPAARRSAGRKDRQALLCCAAYSRRVTRRAQCLARARRRFRGRIGNPRDE
jgi:hypothetical protein